MILDCAAATRNARPDVWRFFIGRSCGVAICGKRPVLILSSNSKFDIEER